MLMLAHADSLETFSWKVLTPCLLSQMQVWDTAGQERFRTITQSYYRSAHAAMITYDITRESTFNSVPQWIREMEQYGAANVLLALIGKHSNVVSVSFKTAQNRVAPFSLAKVPPGKVWNDLKVSYIYIYSTL